jgi:hypothetical protein
VTALATAGVASARPASTQGARQETSFPAGPLPWVPRDLGRALAWVLTGGVGLLAGWVGASGTADFNVQVRWFAIAVSGLVVAGVGIALWTLAGFRNTRLRQHALAASILELVVAPTTSPVITETAAVLHEHDERTALVAVEAGTRFHLGTCPLVQGKSASAAPYPDHERAGRRPCGVCRP